MASFHFRLARVLEWYRKKCRLEESRLSIFIESAARAKTEIELHKEEVLRRRMEVIRSPGIEVFELAALDAFCRQAKRRELQLRQKSQASDQAVERQRKVVQIAQQRLRLVEKLRDRRFEEHRFQDERDLEQLASETWLAAFARDLNDPTG